MLKIIELAFDYFVEVIDSIITNIEIAKNLRNNQKYKKYGILSLKGKFVIYDEKFKLKYPRSEE